MGMGSASAKKSVWFESHNSTGNGSPAMDAGTPGTMNSTSRSLLGSIRGGAGSSMMSMDGLGVGSSSQPNSAAKSAAGGLDTSMASHASHGSHGGGSTISGMYSTSSTPLFDGRLQAGWSSWVIVYGFSSQHTSVESLLRRFQEFGDIVNHKRSTGNWLFIK
jgi:hypothetical protein